MITVWKILADTYFDFNSLCNLLTVSKDIGSLVDLRKHRWHQDETLNNNVVGRLERAFTESMLYLRKFGMEKRTLTNKELWPYFGVNLEKKNRWTIVAPSVELCESTNHSQLRESESFGNSVDGFSAWPESEDTVCSNSYARVKTSHWRTKTPFLRMLYMQKLRHSACKHTEKLERFSLTFSRGRKEEGKEEKEFKSRILRRNAEPMKKKKRKNSNYEEKEDMEKKIAKKDEIFQPRLVNFKPDCDSNKLLELKH